MSWNAPTEDEIDALAEIKAARDILEHNAGVVNEIYRRKAGKRARYEVGDTSNSRTLTTSRAGG